MLFFYVRHGDPIYDPDSLTELGQKQADALAKRLALYGVDKIYASTSNRAQLTAKPTCELLKKDMALVDFANEIHAGKEFMVDTGDGVVRWLFDNPYFKALFSDRSMLALNERWYEHEKVKQYHFERGLDRIYEESDAFFRSLGYSHIRDTGRYKVEKSNDERVALFAHQGFGVAFLSCLLDIPYPVYANHFDICHTGMTVINFQEIDGYAYPKVLTHSSDSHIYKEGLPTNYNNVCRF